MLHVFGREGRNAKGPIAEPRAKRAGDKKGPGALPPLAPKTRSARLLIRLHNPLARFSRVHRHDPAQELDRLGPLPLERIPPDDRPEATPVPDGARLVHDFLVAVALCPAREDHDATA